MSKRWVILAILTVVTGSCGRAPVKSVSLSFQWESFNIGSLAAQDRRLALDPHSGTIWVMDCPLGMIDQNHYPRLMKLSATTPSATDATGSAAIDSSVPCFGPGANRENDIFGLAVDAAGTVWALPGGRLVTFDPTRNRFKTWAVPSVNGLDPSPGANNRRTGDRPPTALAVGSDGTVWLSFEGSQTIARLDPRSSHWSTYDLPSASLSGRMSFLPDGRLITSGVILSGGPGSRAAASSDVVGIIDPRSGATQQTQLNARNFAVLPDGRVAFVDSVGIIQLWSSATGETTSTGVRLDSHLSRPWLSGTTQLVASPSGRLWIYDEMAASVNELVPQQDGAWQKLLFPYPARTVVTRPIGAGRPIAPFPHRQAQQFTDILIAPDGSVWLGGLGELEHLVPSFATP